MQQQEPLQDGVPVPPDLVGQQVAAREISPHSLYRGGFRAGPGRSGDDVVAGHCGEVGSDGHDARSPQWGRGTWGRIQTWRTLGARKVTPSRATVSRLPKADIGCDGFEMCVGICAFRVGDIGAPTRRSAGSGGGRVVYRVDQSTSGGPGYEKAIR